MTDVRHPLEPLSSDEVAAVRDILTASAAVPEGVRFVFVELDEPAKDTVTSWQPGTSWDRRAAVVLRHRELRSTYEAVVSLSDKAVLDWRVVEGRQAPMTEEEFMAIEAIVMADARWQAAMSARGLADLSLAMIDPWASGYTGPEDAPSLRRISRPLTFVRSGVGDNGYARPVEGLIVTFDMDAMAVVDVEDHGVVPLPTRAGNYLPDRLGDADNLPAFGGPRERMKPIEITQPEGASFTVDGHAVSWGNWRLRVGYTPREGLVLHDIGYVDHGRLRPVLHRASVSEMYVPYGDPAPTHWNKNVFDMGEYGLGWLADSLELGCDCLGEIHYFDGVLNDADGNPVVKPNAVCMHEEDFSIAWKHTDFRTGHGEVRRNRRLVVSFIATVANYVYGFYWYLYLDGNIEFEVKLTGILSTGAIEPGATPEYGTLVAPGMYAPNHEHYFSVRLDMRVDGDRNNLFEVDSVAETAGPHNPHANAWRVVTRHLTSESQAQRLPDPVHGRTWLVASADTTNELGSAPAYKIVPGQWTAPLWQQGSQQEARGGFATRQLWGTAFDAAERHAAGRYVAQNPGPDGLVEYTAGDRSLVDSDLVVWYTVGAHHIARPEDWPVMPVSRVGFHLMPFGFFVGSPVLDLPGEAASCH